MRCRDELADQPVSTAGVLRSGRVQGRENLQGLCKYLGTSKSQSTIHSLILL